MIIRAFIDPNGMSTMGNGTSPNRNARRSRTVSGMMPKFMAFQTTSTRAIML
jgi:hypothetical protein